MRIKHLFSLLLIPFSFLLNAQPFTDLQNGFPTLSIASTAWGDYDHDGDLDLAMIGFSSMAAEIGSIYRNDGDGVFTLTYSLMFPVSSGSVNWGDYDHDDDLDLLVTGQNGNSGPPAVTTIYRNEGNDIFTPLVSALPGLIGVARWIDYDNDGWLDVVMSGIGNSFLEDSTRLFHNDTTGIFTEIQIGLPGYFASDISIVDFDNDDDQDFFLVGGTLSSSTNPVSLLFRNDGNAVFTTVPYDFIDLSTGASAWADYDRDGDPDLLYDGIDSTFGNGVTLLYRNDSLGLFTRIDAHLPGSGEPGSVAWADVDNDGDLDILLSGPTALLRNEGNDMYTDITPDNFDVGIPNSFADIDNDGDQDILIISSSGGSSASTIHRNDLLTAITNITEGSDFILYPNPVKEILHFKSQNKFTGDIRLTIMNSVGQVVYAQTIGNSGTTDMAIPVSFLNSSLYFYTLQQHGVLFVSGKFFVE